MTGVQTCALPISETEELIFTTKLRDAKYDESHERALSLRPNHDERRCRRIELSIVSKGAERSNRHKAVTFAGS